MHWDSVTAKRRNLVFGFYLGFIYLRAIPDRAGTRPISVNLSKASADECILSRRDSRSHCQSQRYLSSKLSSCRFRNANVFKDRAVSASRWSPSPIPESINSSSEKVLVNFDYSGHQWVWPGHVLRCPSGSRRDLAILPRVEGFRQTYNFTSKLISARKERLK